MPTTTVIGRDAELAEIRGLLDRASTGPAALVVEGEAGIGKTALLDEAMRFATAQGFLILSSRAAEAEASWSLLGICDLLEDVPRGLFDDLPPPQRRALDVVMRRIDPDGRPVEQATVGAAFRAIVTRLVSERPLLLVLDDLHWLDDASAGVVGYVVRRLESDPVGVLASRRLPELPRLDLAQVLGADATRRIQPGPLSMGALRSTLERESVHPLTRSTLSRIHEASQGNPLFALEICRVLNEVGVPPIGEPLPVPSDIQELVRRRVADLPPPTARLLLRVALTGASRNGLPLASLKQEQVRSVEDAERAGIVRLDGALLRFAHPFHAAAVLAAARPDVVTEVRRELAAESRSDEERARHLCYTVSEPDAAVAQALAEGGEAAAARGASADAAFLLRRAGQLTPLRLRPLAEERTLRAVECWQLAGEFESSLALLDEVSQRDLDNAHKAVALRLRAQVAYAADDLVGAVAALAEGLELDPDAHRCALDLIVVTTQQRDFDRALATCETLLARLDPESDGPLLAEALATTAMTRFWAGEGIDWTLVERALELEDADQVPSNCDTPSTCAAYLARYAHRWDEARSRLIEMRDHGNLLGHHDGYVQTWLGPLELECGNFAAALEHYDQGIALTRLTGSVGVHDQLVAGRVLAAVHLGDLDALRRRSEVTHAPGGIAVTPLLELRALLMAALSDGDYGIAWQACEGRIERFEREGIREPSLDHWVPDAVEVMVGVGLGDRADALLRCWEERGRDLGYPWALAIASRCRAVLLAARGDDAAAVAAADDALDGLTDAGLPFQRSRALLIRGITLRRLRRRRDARESLEESHREFERMGCRLWAEKARDELARIGGRAATKGDLSPSEHRVVELAAGGASNKEIAAILSVSVHTVESHLSHAFVKLGITRRGQLASRLAAGAPRSD